jgi:hypothetical protein
VSPARLGTARTRIAAGRSRSVRRRWSPPRPDALWDRCQVDRSTRISTRCVGPGTSAICVRAGGRGLHRDHHQHTTQHGWGVRHRQQSDRARAGPTRRFCRDAVQVNLGAEPGRLAYFKRPSFFGEILCCWRPRWIAGTKKSPMHADAWCVWRKEPQSGPSLKVRVGRRETIAALSHEHAGPTPSVREVADFP